MIQANIGQLSPYFQNILSRMPEYLKETGN
jgi:hypothetical protein